MQTKFYRLATDDEKSCCDEYDELIGPNGFSCVLTEPEDRKWYRDGREVVEELNRLHGLLIQVSEGEIQLDQLKELLRDSGNG